MEFLMLLGILASLAPFAVGGIVLYAALKRAGKVGGGYLGPGGFGGLPISDIDALYRQIAQAIQAMQASGGGGVPGGMPGTVPPQLLAQWQRMQSDLRASDRLGQERLDMRRGELMSMASSAGIDVKL
jgi:hypothetical protein